MADAGAKFECFKQARVIEGLDFGIPCARPLRYLLKQFLPRGPWSPAALASVSVRYLPFLVRP